MKLIILGEVPSKKDQQQIYRNRYTGKPFITSSKKHKEWHRKAIAQLDDISPVLELKRLSMTFYSATRRKSDLTNRADSVQDLLVDAGILEDDNWFVIPKLELNFGGVDKENPRVVVSFEV